MFSIAPQLVGNNGLEVMRAAIAAPGQRHGGSWAMYAFDPKEKAHIGHRSREWTAVGNTEEECIRETARVLEEIAEGRVRNS